MTNLILFNETPQLAEGMPGCTFNGVGTKNENNDFAAWIATLTQLADEHERGVRGRRNTEGDSSSRELKSPLQKVAAGPWRSLGGYFDYSHWADRERFLELDRAIAASQELREPEVDQDIEMI